MRQRKRILGGGQDFQNQDPWAPLPENLRMGPPPATQPGAEIPGFPALAGSTGTNAPQAAVGSNLADPWRTLLNGILRRCNLQQTFGTVSTQATLIRPAESRIYLLLQNTSLANQLIVAFGYAPQLVTGGATGFVLAPNGGSIEPACIPQQDVWVFGSAAGTTWVLGVATQ
jgi:hypothetical protein